jgi:hypothetical protein
VTPKTLIPVEEALAQTTSPLARTVLEYSLIFKRLLEQAKQSGGISPADWGPLAELVAVDEFERVGASREVMNWQEYTGFLSGFANAASWTGRLRRVSELPGLVFLELEERGKNPEDGSDFVANTVTVYEFNAAGKICHLDVYVQSAAQ